MKACKTPLGEAMLEAGLGYKIQEYLYKKYVLGQDPKPISFEGKMYRPEYGRIQS